jgi:hypothetical protein
VITPVGRPVHDGVRSAEATRSESCSYVDVGNAFERTSPNSLPAPFRRSRRRVATVDVRPPGATDGVHGDSSNRTPIRVRRGKPLRVAAGGDRPDRGTAADRVSRGWSHSNPHSA